MECLAFKFVCLGGGSRFYKVVEERAKLIEVGKVQIYATGDEATSDVTTKLSPMIIN